MVGNIGLTSCKSNAASLAPQRGDIVPSEAEPTQSSRHSLSEASLAWPASRLTIKWRDMRLSAAEITA